MSLRMRVKPPRERGTLAEVVLGFGNAFAGVCEWLEDVEQGAEPMRAAKKAYRKVQRRKAALRKADGKHSPSEAPEGGVVIDVTPEVERRRRVAR